MLLLLTIVDSLYELEENVYIVNTVVVVLLLLTIFISLYELAENVFVVNTANAEIQDFLHTSVDANIKGAAVIVASVAIITSMFAMPTEFCLILIL